MEPGEFKECPICGKSIRMAAIKCRYCGGWLTQGQPAETSQQTGTQRPITAPLKESVALTSPMEVSADLQNESDNAQGGSAELSQPGKKRSGYWVRHWRGELALPVAYWVNGLLLTLLVLIASSALFTSQDVFSTKVYAGLVICLYAVIMGITVWQFVGIWRSACNHTARGGRQIWATLAKALVVLGAVKSVLLLVNTYAPQSIEMAQILTGDSKMPPYTIRVLPGGTEAEFRGGLRAGCAADLERVVAAVPDLKVLHINSGGGRINEARRLMQIVRNRNLTTYTSERCLSAATLVLMSGKERVVAVGAKVGFHAGRLPGATIAQQREMDDLVRETMESAGVSSAFIQRVLATPSHTMWYPSLDEMRKAGVITGESYGDRFAASWNVSENTATKLEQSFKKLPGFRAISEFEPEMYGHMIQDYTSAVRAGKSEGEAVSMITARAQDLMVKYIPSASDEALLKLCSQWVQMLEKYKDNNSQACLAAFTGAKVNYVRAFPDWNMTNSLIVLEHIITSGANRNAVPIDSEKADADLSDIMRILVDKFGDDVIMLDQKDRWAANSRKVCEMSLALYKGVQELAPEREANILRYFLTSAE